MKKTWIEREEVAYPNGAMVRNGRAILHRNPHNPIDLPYGNIVAFRAGIPDTFFSIPAKIRFKGKTVHGFVSIYTNEDEFSFTPEAARNDPGPVPEME